MGRLLWGPAGGYCLGGCWGGREPEAAEALGPGEPQEVRECRELCFLRTLSLWLLWGWR